MKEAFTFLIATLFCTLSFAQAQESHQSSTDEQSSTLIERPDVIIKGEELKNFLGGSLSEMLMGHLPGLDQTNIVNQDSKVVFMVDGIVWSNIDAININNIEEIAYYRGGLSHKLGIQNTGSYGVIFITTKTAKFNQPLHTEVNTLLGNNTFKSLDQKSAFQSYNVAVSQGIEKLSWRTSAVFNKSTRNLNGNDFTQQFQLNANVRYNPLTWLDVKLNANYAPANGDIENTNTFWDAEANQSTKVKHGNWNGLLSAKVSLIKGLTNELSFSKSKLKDRIGIDFLHLSSPTYPINSHNEIIQKAKINRTVLKNDLQYRFNIDQDRISFKAGTFFQYDKMKFNKSESSRSSQFKDNETPDLSGIYIQEKMHMPGATLALWETSLQTYTISYL